MKKYYYLLCVMAAAVMLSGCGKDPEPDPTPDPVPAVKITDVESTVDGISFVLTTEEADAYAYACITEAEYTEDKYELTRKEGAADKEKVEIASLTPETRYKIVAMAYNGTIKSEKVVETISTLPVEIIAPEISIAEVTADITAITFELSHTGTATAYHWAIYEDGSEDAPQFTTITDISEGQPTGVTAEGLTPETAYVIEAYASAGDTESERVKSQPVTTLEDPDSKPKAVRVNITGITQTDATITVTMDPELCTKYYIGADQAAYISSEDIFLNIDEYGDDFLKTRDIEGPLCDNVYVGMWGDSQLMMDTEYAVWVVACDTEGNFVEEESSIEYYHFSTQGHLIGGSATVAADVLSVSTGKAEVRFTPGNGAVKYYYASYTKAIYDNNYSTEAALIKSLANSSLNGTATKEHTFSNLNVNTEYYFCAVAVDADNVFGTPVKVLTTIPDYDYTSTIAMSPSVVAAESDYGKTTVNLGISSSDMDKLRDVRVVFCTASQFAQGSYFGGDESKVKEKLASGGYPSIVVGKGSETISQSLSLTANLSNDGKLVISGNNHKYNTNYLFYAMAGDNDGKLTEWEKLIIATGTFDMTGTANSTTEIIGSQQSTDGDNTYKWTEYTVKVSPNSATKEFWVGIITAELAGTMAPTQKIEHCITDYYSVHYVGNSPQEMVFTATSDSYLWVACKDEDGKFNNVHTDAAAQTFLENIYK